MKKAGILLLLSLFSVITFSQTGDDAFYGFGKVPVRDGMVVFSREIPFDASKVTSENIYNTTLQWIKGRFVKPIVLSGRIKETPDRGIAVNAEEYLIFRKTALLTDRTRINYNMTVKVSEHSCILTVTDINYWYEEERDGGVHFTAEDWITDSEAFNRKGTKMMKTTGKFRVKTIDLVNSFEKEIRDIISMLESSAESE
ncbi:MAG: DUF4468 domain-containing protein [Bacteroidaceae bacterium]|nr:DUF4468 domain-containing protein [Bacteroidaceae bacterium]